MRNIYLKIGIAILITIVIISITLVTANGVTVNIMKADDIDVALTTGTTDIEVSRFERDLEDALENKGIDKSRVNVQAFDAKTTSTETQDASEIFADWESLKFGPSGSNNQMYLNGEASTADWVASGSRVTANTTGWRPARAWINPEPVETDGGTNFSFIWGIDEKDYGSFEHGEAGFVFGIEDDRNFYVYIMDNHDLCGHIRLQGGEAIIKVKDGKFTGGVKDRGNEALAHSEEFPKYSAGLKQNIDISIRNNEITVTRNGEVVLEAIDEEVENIGGSYGFYVWDQYGAYFDNIGFTTESKREFNEVIRQPEWRDNSKRFIVNMEDEIQGEFDDEKKMGEILSRLINEKIDYIGVGSTTNKKQAEELIDKNNGNGKFIDSSIEYNEMINQIADRIVSQLSSGDKEEYVIVGEKYDFKVSPDNILKNTETTEYPDGRWKIEHDYNYYDNTSGRHELDGKYFPNFDVNFDKSGRYRIIFEESTTFPEYIHAHRRPVASYSVEVTKDGDNYKTKTNDFSYDLDRESKSNKGIVEHEWKWMETGASKWTNGKIPERIDKNKDYVIQLRVKDEQGVWSDPVSRYITTAEGDSQPIANFDMPLESLIYDEVNVNNTSYDPAGKEITVEEWVVTKYGTEVYRGSEPLVDFKEYGDGRYIISLRVKNDKTWSETFNRVINITKDNISPDIFIDKDSVDWTNSNISVNATFKDDGGSGFKSQRFAITNTTTKPNTGWSSWSTSTSRKIDIITEGVNYVHIEAQDNEGNWDYKRFGPYKFDKTNPTVNVNERKDREPHENVILDVVANDTFSGIKKIMYIGEDMVTNGDFKHSLNNWQIYSGSITEKDGVVSFENKVSADNRTRLRQLNIFEKSVVGATYYAEINAKGNGILNTRFSFGSHSDGGKYVDEYAREINDDKFQTYTFLMDRKDFSRNHLVVEKVGSGAIDINNIKVFAQKDITKNKNIEVEKNGSYTFVVEDHAGNITTKTHNVDSIVRELSMKANSDDIKLETTIGQDMNLETSIDDITITDWRDEVPNNWRLTLQSGKLTNGVDLPVGTVNFAGVDKVNKIDGGSSNAVESTKNIVAVDDGAMNVLKSKDERGVYNVKFTKDALRFKFNPSQINKGEYKTKLTWTLENTLDVK